MRRRTTAPSPVRCFLFVVPAPQQARRTDTNIRCAAFCCFVPKNASSTSPIALAVTTHNNAKTNIAFLNVGNVLPITHKIERSSAGSCTEQVVDRLQRRHQYPLRGLLLLHRKERIEHVANCFGGDQRAHNNSKTNIAFLNVGMYFQLHTKLNEVR